jgi:hypothetical protein
MNWRKLYSLGEYRYHIGRQNVVIQRMEPYSQKKLVVRYTELLQVQYPNITWNDLDGVAITPSDVQKFIDSSKSGLFDQPKKKKK